MRYKMSLTLLFATVCGDAVESHTTVRANQLACWISSIIDGRHRCFSKKEPLD